VAYTDSVESEIVLVESWLADNRSCRSTGTVLDPRGRGTSNNEIRYKRMVKAQQAEKNKCVL
jgi:hypothetical protein